MTCGIYAIINQVNGKFYVGSACNIKRRWYNHRRDLKKGIHGNKHLRNAWNKYGEGSFYFGVLEPVKNKEDLLNREQYWMDELQPEYNILPTAGSPLGFKWTEESKQKQSEANKGEKNPMFGRTGEKNPMWGKHPICSEETKQKLSEINKGENSSKYKRAKRWEYNGKSKPLSDWAREYGLDPRHIQTRVNTQGWSLKRALTTPARKFRRAPK